MTRTLAGRSSDCACPGGPARLRRRRVWPRRETPPRSRSAWDREWLRSGPVRYRADHFPFKVSGMAAGPIGEKPDVPSSQLTWSATVSAPWPPLAVRLPSIVTLTGQEGADTWPTGSVVTRLTAGAPAGRRSIPAAKRAAPASKTPPTLLGSSTGISTPNALRPPPTSPASRTTIPSRIRVWYTAPPSLRPSVRPHPGVTWFS